MVLGDAQKYSTRPAASPVRCRQSSTGLLIAALSLIGTCWDVADPELVLQREMTLESTLKSCDVISASQTDKRSLLRVTI